ncbi:peroxisome biogenesis factor 10 [Monosporozyma unispora]|nr:peroxisome biogenesis factor 10 [Kazachstania unispora]
MGESRFTFADAASIVQSYQKDSQIETIIIQKLTAILQGLKGQLFVNLYPQQIASVAKFVYLLLTTFQNERTLGQEYVDLMYVNKDGRRLTKRGQRLGYILSVCFGPYLVTRLIRKLKVIVSKEEGADGVGENDNEEDIGNCSSLKSLIDLGMNLHLMLFYFEGTYSDIWKRIFGLRYMVTHKVGDQEKKFREGNANTYKTLGYVLMLQTLTQGIPLITRQVSYLLNQGSKSGDEDFSSAQLGKVITKIPERSQVSHITLEDPTVLPFIPSESRSCTLCLSPMTDPSCAPCGHTYCWDCLQNWCNERPECPLCRQKCHPQQIQPLL